LIKEELQAMRASTSGSYFPNTDEMMQSSLLPKFSASPSSNSLNSPGNGRFTSIAGSRTNRNKKETNAASTNHLLDQSFSSLPDIHNNNNQTNNNNSNNNNTHNASNNKVSVSMIIVFSIVLLNVINKL
jgi:hypothetical protein